VPELPISLSRKSHMPSWIVFSNGTLASNSWEGTSAQQSFRCRNVSGQISNYVFAFSWRSKRSNAVHSFTGFRIHFAVTIRKKSFGFGVIFSIGNPVAPSWVALTVFGYNQNP